MGVCFHETQRWNDSTFFEFESNGWKWERHEHQMLKFDGGGEYFSNEFNEYLKKWSIQNKKSCNYFSQ